MKISEYFNSASGTGILSTANKDGEVNGAIYAKPSINSSREVSFITRNKKTRANLQQNPHAHYLFIEANNGYKGVRMSLTMTKESTDKVLIDKLSRRKHASSEVGSDRYLVTFEVNKVIELIGDKEIITE